MTDAFDNAYRASTSQMEVNFVPKTKQEIVQLCAKHPENPVARDLLMAVAPYGEEHIHHILPISIQAVEANRTVEIAYRMEPISNPTTGKREFKRVQYLTLGAILPVTNLTEEVPHDKI